MKMKTDIVGIGHPRTGTGYTSAVLRSWGLQVGHEKLKRNGVVAWELIKDESPWLWLHKKQITDKYRPEHCHLIYNVRDPLHSIPSIIYTEDTNEESIEFRSRVLGFNRSSNPVEQAIDSIVEYDKKAKDIKPSIIYRVDHDTKHLYDYLKNYYDLLEYVGPSNKSVNTRTHSDLNSLEEYLNLCSSEHKDKIDSFCRFYEYPSIFEKL
jgi:hypothetical protein